MNDVVEVYSPGTQIKFVNGHENDIFDKNLPIGTIIEVCIDEYLNPMYKVVWWNGNSRSEGWIKELEFVIYNTTAKTKIGFVNNKV